MLPLIQVRELGKRYRLGARRLPYRTLRDYLQQIFTRRWCLPASKHQDFWALKDINLDVFPGETVGIIGSNGAGKSTFLKVLSSITRPTEGYIHRRGRLGSMLEVGTGFHPELSGRENIYLSGAILGMRREEIRRNFDQIVQFAEVEAFLDTPVKHYSSGMYVRLAFAVAVHLESEILIIDEVLAVGDAQFQKKCFSKMVEVGGGGRTILFVSHNMAAMRQICSRGIVLSSGHVVEDAPVDIAVDRYLHGIHEQQQKGMVYETEDFVVTSVEIFTPDALVIKTFSPLKINVNVLAKQEIRDPGLYVGFLTEDQQRISGMDLKDFRDVSPIVKGERRTLGFVIDSIPFLPGRYHIEVHLKDMARDIIQPLPTTYPFEVAESCVYGGRKLDKWFGTIGLQGRAFAGKGDAKLAKIAKLQIAGG